MRRCFNVFSFIPPGEKSKRFFVYSKSQTKFFVYIEAPFAVDNQKNADFDTQTEQRINFDS